MNNVTALCLLFWDFDDGRIRDISIRPYLSSLSSTRAELRSPTAVNGVRQATDSTKIVAKQRIKRRNRQTLEVLYTSMNRSHIRSGDLCGRNRSIALRIRKTKSLYRNFKVQFVKYRVTNYTIYNTRVQFVKFCDYFWMKMLIDILRNFSQKYISFNKYKYIPKYYREK